MTFRSSVLVLVGLAIHFGYVVAMIVAALYATSYVAEAHGSSLVPSVLSFAFGVTIGLANIALMVLWEER